MNPLSRLLQERLPKSDVGIMDHGFASHGRDYVLTLEDSLGPTPGTYRLTFTHVVEFNFLTAVGDDVWQKSWSDEFTDYARWEESGEPDGYVFGTNWSLAYPGFETHDNDAAAASWSARLQRAMYAATIESDRFSIKLIFHDVELAQVSDDVSTVSRVIIPLLP